MALHEYRCNQCGGRFEFLLRVSETDKDAECPKCGAHDAVKEFSSFSSPGCDENCGPKSFG
jgi:putative FmdB family regulatory protein